MFTTKDSKNKEEKSFKKNELMDIFENIIEVNSNDGQKIKRRNSFTGNNIFQKMKKEKEKEIEKNKKLTANNPKEQKQEKEIININENDKNSISLSKLEINEINQNAESLSPLMSNKKSIEITKVSKLKREKSYKTLKNNYNKMALNEKNSNTSTFSANRNFILKSELFKKDYSYNNPIENERMRKNILFLLTKKTETQVENQFCKYFIGNNLEDKIDFKQNNDNKKNIYSNTYIDNEEEELNKEKNKFKSIINGFDDKTFDEKYILKKNLITYNQNKEDEIIQEQKLKEKVFKFLKCDKCDNDIDMDKKSNFENISEDKSKSINQNNNVNLNYQNDNKNNNNKNLIHYSIQNNYINNNFNIQNPQKFIDFNQGKYYPYIQSNPYQYMNSQINPNFYQYNNQMYFNPNMNINNNIFPQYNNKVNQYNNNIYQMNNNINNQNIYNNLNNIDDINLAKMSLNLLKNQIGCKVLDERVKSNTKFANELLFPELKNNLSHICCDILGNILVQTLIDILSFENLNLFLLSIQEQLFDICLTEHGSRVIQKLIERIHTFPLLINKLIFNLNKKDIGILFKSGYANHMIQKYLTIIKDVELTNFIYNYLYKNFMDIARSKYGVCVIQKGLSEGNIIQRKKIINLILNNLNFIMKDCYGNFIIQFIFFKFDKNKFDEILPIVQKIEENIVDFCKNKFSSSVIEKCFEKNEIRIGERFIKCLFEQHANDVIDIILNSFGKYVIKKACNFENKLFRNMITNIIVGKLNQMKQTPEGGKIIQILKNDYPEFSFLFYEQGKYY